jgi:cyclophilin family peptidyl-prolyl cis-trans isomerase
MRFLLTGSQPGAPFVPDVPASLSLPALRIMLHPSPALAKTTANFIALCSGSQGAQKKAPYRPYNYKGSPIHRVERGFVLQGGDITRGDGSGGDSICTTNHYSTQTRTQWVVIGTDGGNLPMEKAGLKPGLLDPPLQWGTGSIAMAASSSGKSTSQFFICLTDEPAQLKKLNGKYVLFGHVVGPDGWLEIVRTIEKRGAEGEKVWIEDCSAE